MAWSLLLCTTVPKTSNKWRHQSALAGWIATMLIFQTHFILAAFTQTCLEKGAHLASQSFYPSSWIWNLSAFVTVFFPFSSMWSQLCFLSTGAGSSPGGVPESLRWVFTSFLFSRMQDNTVKVVCLRGSSAYSKKWVTAGSFPAPTTHA